jgi:molybdenum cofactor synthesis domain-containing protein
MSQLSAPEKDFYTAALVIIGNEILAGRTQDTNTPWIAERLTAQGIGLAEVRIVSDSEEDIIKAVNDVRERYDYVFTTGGIGPTHDDITAQSIAKAFGRDLVQNEHAFDMLEEHYGITDLTPARVKMAMIPQDALLIPNPVSAAPGFSIENVYVMAGVPRIMQAMFDYVMGTIRAGKPILSNMVACSLQESVVAEDLSQLQKNYPMLQMGSYPHYRGGVLGLSLVLRGSDKKVLEKATAELIAIIKSHGDEPRALSVRSEDHSVDVAGERAESSSE